MPQQTPATSLACILGLLILSGAVICNLSRSRVRSVERPNSCSTALPVEMRMSSRLCSVRLLLAVETPDRRPGRLANKLAVQPVDIGALQSLGAICTPVAAPSSPVSLAQRASRWRASASESPIRQQSSR